MDCLGRLVGRMRVFRLVLSRVEGWFDEVQDITIECL